MVSIYRSSSRGAHSPSSHRQHSIAFPYLFPSPEQQRIVAKVEALLARVNAARERLAKAPAILKRFRQSVLAAACSGQLTADWREDKDSHRGQGCEEWKQTKLGALLREPLRNGHSARASGDGPESVH